MLTWQTASEPGNVDFQIQCRVGDRSPWQQVGVVESNADGGTSSTPPRYRFVDADAPATADALACRPQQIDLNGSASHSETRTVALGAPDVLALRAPFPTPTRGTVTLRYALPTAANVLIDFFDVMGRHVATLRDDTEPSGRNEVQFASSRLLLLAPRYSPSPSFLHSPTPPPSLSRRRQFRRPPPSRR